MKESLISFDNDFFSITFYKVKNTKENTKEKLSEKTQLVFDAIKNNPDFLAEQISELLGFTVDAVRQMNCPHITQLNVISKTPNDLVTKRRIISSQNAE